MIQVRLVYPDEYHHIMIKNTVFGFKSYYNLYGGKKNEKDLYRFFIKYCLVLI
jgi:hypothetical protein